ncbi:MAG: hypothetical protein LIP77_08425 [Planctomycetes bacterium]|nr:hypothetical protein [Planctomycetota bacterium]
MTTAPETEPLYLDDVIRRVQSAVEQKFLFRKIGLPYDYASSPDDFPSKAFATAKEARNNLPNPLGEGGGFYHTCRNHALLFDGYLLRLEIGIEAPGDEAILDRLIGGLIRLATVAPKSFLVGGLATDGRGFYAQPRVVNHVAWAFAVSRGLMTAAIAPESQEKFRSIAGKWMDRLKREKFRLHGMDGKPAPDGDISRPDPDTGPLQLALMLAAARASGDSRDFDLYTAAVEENDRARLGDYTPPDGDPALTDMVWRQSAWSIIAGLDPDPERVALAKTRQHSLALAASRHLSAWRGWDPSLVGTPVDLAWRTFPKAPLEENPLGFIPPDSWQRLDREAAIAQSLAAAHVLLLAGDPALAEVNGPEIQACLAGIPWEDLITLTALAPAIAVHARGVEMGLWDKTLYDSRREPPASEISFAAKYLEPDYDDVHPEQRGHDAPPPGKKKADKGAKSEPGGNKKRRRRRRK